VALCNPAGHRLQQKGWLRAEWKQSETGRKAKFYSLTAAGRKQLAVEKDSWARLSGTVQPDLRGGQPMIQLFNWLRRGSLERGLDRELQYHFDRRVADLAAAGISEPEAHRRVAVELGLSQVREEVRDVWLTRWLHDFLYDLRFSAQSLVRTPSFVAVGKRPLSASNWVASSLPLSMSERILRKSPKCRP
jgi:hypothetical protein